MSDPDLSKLDLPLSNFAALWGLSPADIANLEEPEIIHLSRDVQPEQAKELTEQHFTDLANAYGPAFSFEILAHYGESNEVILSSAEDHKIDAERLKRFQAEFEVDTGKVHLECTLNKAAIITERLGQSPPACQLFLYLYPDALETSFGERVDVLEEVFWETEHNCKIVIFVPAREVSLDGPYLAIVGGTRLRMWHTTVPNEPPDFVKTKQMFDACRAHLKWQTDWLKRVTPLHVNVKGDEGTGGKLKRSLQIQLATLTALYTADLTVEESEPATPTEPKHFISTYAGSPRPLKMPLKHVKEMVEKNLPADADFWLIKIIRWTYNSPFPPSSRLPLVQTAIAAYLVETGEEEIFESFIRTGKRNLEILEAQWKAVLQNKVETYLSQAKGLEESVSSTVSAISQQISELIKSLSEAMLAAVAAVVGTMLGALFQERFRPLILVAGMLLYGAYIFFFQLLFNMSVRRGNYEALINDYEKRKIPLVDVLTKTRVEEIEGDRLRKQKRAFEIWFARALVAYLGVAVLAALVAWQATQPTSFISSIVASVASTASATATLTATHIPAIPTVTP